MEVQGAMLVGIGIAAVALAAIWLVGGLIARVLGIAMCVLGVGALLIGESGGLLFLALGGLLWIAGQWFFAFKYHGWRSPLARRLFSRTPLRALDPTRRWGTRVVHQRQRNEPQPGWRTRRS